MWQRIQTLYLTLAAIACILPICIAPSMMEIPHAWSLWMVSGAVSLLSLVTIFLYKKRLVQFRLNMFSMVLCLGYYGLLAMMTWFAVKQAEMVEVAEVAEELAEPLNWHPTWVAAMPLVAFILLIMATKRILADEALVRSMDRLR